MFFEIIPLLLQSLSSGFAIGIIEYIKPSAELTKITSQGYVKTMESIILSGVVGIDVLIAQAFITTNSNEFLIRLSLFCFAIGIPLLAIGILLNQVIWKAGYQANSLFSYNLIKVIGVFSSFVGLSATFWHAFWLIGVAFLTSGIIGILIALIYIGSLEDNLRGHGKKVIHINKDNLRDHEKKIVVKNEEITSEVIASLPTQFVAPKEQKETINNNEKI